MVATSTHEPPIIRDDVPMVDYHADPAIGSTPLKRALRSAAHYATPDERDTKALILGRLAHTMVLEPEILWDVYAPPFARTASAIEDSGAALKEAAKSRGLKVSGKKEELLARIAEADPAARFESVEAVEWTQRYPGLPVSIEDLALAGAMSDAVRRFDDARELSGGMRILPPGFAPEVSIWWTDEDTGMRCKCRPDALVTGAGYVCIVDLKTTRDAQPKPFARACASYRYDVSAAHYIRGVRAAQSAGLLPDGPVIWVWLAVESAAPHGVRAYDGGDWIDIGDEDRARAMDVVAHYRASGKAAAYDTNTHRLSVPGWHERRYEL